MPLSWRRPAACASIRFPEVSFQCGVVVSKLDLISVGGGKEMPWEMLMHSPRSSRGSSAEMANMLANILEREVAVVTPTV